MRQTRKTERRAPRNSAGYPAFCFLVCGILLCAACSGDETADNGHISSDSSSVKSADSAYVAPEQTLARVFGISKFSELQRSYPGGYTLATVDTGGITPATSSGSLADYGFDWATAELTEFSRQRLRFRAPDIIRAEDNSRSTPGEILLELTSPSAWRQDLSDSVSIGCEIAYYDSASVIIAIGIIPTSY